MSAILPEEIQNKLIETGILVPEEEKELEQIIAENHQFSEEDKEELYEIVQPTAMCQLGCYYCGQKHTKDQLSESLIDKLANRILDKFAAGKYSRLYIGWFGAEPLMGLPQMRELYRKLRAGIPTPEIPIRGKIVTNGMSLKEGIFFELIDDFHIDQIEITLDGVGDVHDAHRPLKNGEPSFDIIYKNLTQILQHPRFDKNRCRTVIRCNVDEKNHMQIEPLIRKLAADGLHKKINKLYFVGIYSWGGNDAHKQALTKEKFAMLKMQWDILKIRLGYPFRPKLYDRKKQTCIATGGKSEMYDAFGNIFNCTEISYSDYYANSHYNLGNIKDPKTIDRKPLHDWYDTVRDTDQFPCHRCKLLPVCGGSCPKSWHEGIPACPSFKFSILKELELEYLLRRTEEPLLPEALDHFSNNLNAEHFFRYE